MMEKNLPERIPDRPMKLFPNLWPNFFEGWPHFFETGFPFKEEIMARGERIYEENNHLIVEVPLPGLDAKNAKEIEVSLNKGVLWIRGESRQEKEDKKRKFYRFAKRDYSYSIALPTQIDERQEPQATYEDGILKVALQLAKHAESKKIPVKVSKK